MARAPKPFTDTERQIARNIRVLRDIKGITQAELAERMGGDWTATTVSKVEGLNDANSRHLGLDESYRLAQILGVTLDELRLPVMGDSEFLTALRAGTTYSDSMVTVMQSVNRALDRFTEYREADAAYRKAGRNTDAEAEHAYEQVERMAALAPALLGFREEYIAATASEDK